MPDLFDDFGKIFKRDFVPILVKYLKDPDNKISDNINEFLNDPKTLLTDIFDKFSINKENKNQQVNYTDIENITTIDEAIDDEYDDLLKKLSVIEQNMIQIKKILKDKN